MFVPGEYIISADSAIIGALIVVCVALSRTRERIARLEGRLDEIRRERGDDEP